MILFGWSVECFYESFSPLISCRDLIPNHQQPLAVLRDSQTFGRHIVTSAIFQLQQGLCVCVCVHVHVCVCVCVSMCTYTCVWVCVWCEPRAHLCMVQSHGRGGGGGGGGGGLCGEGGQDSFKLLCSLAPPLFRLVETGRRSPQQGSKEKVRHPVPCPAHTNSACAWEAIQLLTHSHFELCQSV